MSGHLQGSTRSPIGKPSALLLFILLLLSGGLVSYVLLTVERGKFHPVSEGNIYRSGQLT
jgi:hypothetical protein